MRDVVPGRGELVLCIAEDNAETRMSRDRLLPTKRHSSFTSTSTFEYSTLSYRACCVF
jgi:hypothetical protein